jgi:hypothetical protein
MLITIWTSFTVQLNRLVNYSQQENSHYQTFYLYVKIILLNTVIKDKIDQTLKTTHINNFELFILKELYI